MAADSPVRIPGFSFAGEWHNTGARNFLTSTDPFSTGDTNKNCIIINDSVVLVRHALYYIQFAIRPDFYRAIAADNAWDNLKFGSDAPGIVRLVLARLMTARTSYLEEATDNARDSTPVASASAALLQVNALCLLIDRLRSHSNEPIKGLENSSETVVNERFAARRQLWRATVADNPRSLIWTAPDPTSAATQKAMSVCHDVEFAVAGSDAGESRPAR
jgi:hypothetical protein